MRKQVSVLLGHPPACRTLLRWPEEVNAVTFEDISERGERVSPVGIQREERPGTGSSQCKVSEKTACLACLLMSKEASVAGAVSEDSSGRESVGARSQWASRFYKKFCFHRE